MRDIDIRRELLREMKHLHGNDPDTLIVEELGLCQGSARVDIAVINGNIHGYEIKSECDTLNRLPGQTTTYNQVLDYVTIVTEPAHVKEIAKLVPKWWGISIAVPGKEGIKLKPKRRPRQNKTADPFAYAQLLWRNEALEVLSDLGMANGIKSKTRELLWRRLAASVPADELRGIVRHRLKLRAAKWRAPVTQVSCDGLFQPSARL